MTRGARKDAPIFPTTYPPPCAQGLGRQLGRKTASYRGRVNGLAEDWGEGAKPRYRVLLPGSGAAAPLSSRVFAIRIGLTPMQNNANALFCFVSLRGCLYASRAVDIYLLFFNFSEQCAEGLGAIH